MSSLMKKSYLVLLLLIIAFTACKKNEEVTVVGNITLSVHVKHHTLPVSNAIVYIKYNTETFPGKDPALYNASRSCNTEGVANFTELFPGHYYLYAEGHDGNDSVMGYQPEFLDESIAGTVVQTTLLVTE